MQIKDFITISLTDFWNSYAQNQDLFILLKHPGVIGIHSVARNKTYFLHSENCWARMSKLCSDLVFERTSESDELSCSKSRDGLESLTFIIFTLGPKWKSFEKREKALRTIKKNWSYESFDSN